MKTLSRLVLTLSIVFSFPASLLRAQEGEKSSTIVGSFDGTNLSEVDMRKDIALDIYDAESSLYDVKKDWIEKKAKDAFFDQAAKESKLSRKDWEKRVIDDKAGAPSPAEIQEFVHHNMPPAMASTPEAAERAKGYLTHEKHDKREEEVYQELLKKHHVEIRLAKPVAPHVKVAYAADDPVKGPANAPVTILEFTDFQCPYCRASQDTLKQVEQKYAGQVKLVARQYPLPPHNRARPAAGAALCANEQGKFWEYRDKLFDKQELSDADFPRYAKELGLDQGKFAKCLSEHRYAARIEKDIADGQSFGVKGTPTFFINGRPLVGNRPLEDFSQAITEELAQVKPKS